MTALKVLDRAKDCLDITRGLYEQAESKRAEEASRASLAASNYARALRIYREALDAYNKEMGDA